MDLKSRKLALANASEVTEIISTALAEDFPMYGTKTISAYHKKVFTKKYFLDLLKDKKMLFWAHIREEI